MNKQDAESCLDAVIGALPDEIAAALEDVTVYVVDGREDPELGHAIRNSGLEQANVRRDFRGLFLGTQAVPLGGSGLEEPAPWLPQGSIVLNAAAMQDLEDVRDTLAHEMGHALGLTEDEVEDLGLA